MHCSCLLLLMMQLRTLQIMLVPSSIDPEPLALMHWRAHLNTKKIWLFLYLITTSNSQKQYPLVNHLLQMWTLSPRPPWIIIWCPQIIIECLSHLLRHPLPPQHRLFHQLPRIIISSKHNNHIQILRIKIIPLDTILIIHPPHPHHLLRLPHLHQETIAPLVIFCLNTLWPLTRHFVITKTLWLFMNIGKFMSFPVSIMLVVVPQVLVMPIKTTNHIIKVALHPRLEEHLHIMLIILL